VTYYNECYAVQHGVNLLHYGPCDDGIDWIGCDQELCDGGTEYCHYSDSCGEYPGDGQDEPLPGFLACPSVMLPVCGCDGATYDNECKARAVGVSVQHDGECTS